MISKRSNIYIFGVTRLDAKFSPAATKDGYLSESRVRSNICCHLVVHHLLSEDLVYTSLAHHRILIITIVKFDYQFRYVSNTHRLVGNHDLLMQKPDAPKPRTKMLHVLATRCKSARYLCRTNRNFVNAFYISASMLV